jgi:hypothetical protein
MVSVKNTNADLVLRDIFVALAARLNTLSADSIDSAFAVWIFPAAITQMKPVLPQNLIASNYSDMAHLGYFLEIHPEQFSSYENMLLDGLNRTSQRSATIAGVGPAAFFNDAVGLLGIALAARRVGGDTQSAIIKWMKGFFENAFNNSHDWKKLLIKAATCILSFEIASLKTSINSQPDLQLALSSRGISCFPSLDFNQVYHEINQGTIFQEPEISMMAARLQAIDYLCNHLPAISLTQPRIEQVVEVLSNMGSSFKRWIWEEKPKTTTGTAQKWDIQNEYHVQSLLYFVLAPLFPDIESEFYLENTGQLNPRADIGLPSLNLIIEVKYLRSTKNFAGMIEEVAADATLYFKKDGVYKDKYTQMLVFLWDDTNRSQEHSTFKIAVKKFTNICDVVVLSRPGIMGVGATPPKKKYS